MLLAVHRAGVEFAPFAHEEELDALLGSGENLGALLVGGDAALVARQCLVEGQRAAFEFLDDLPKGPTGKILKRELR